MRFRNDQHKFLVVESGPLDRAMRERRRTEDQIECAIAQLLVQCRTVALREGKSHAWLLASEFPHQLRDVFRAEAAQEAERDLAAVRIDHFGKLGTSILNLA